MAVKRYNGSDWDTVAGVGSQGATGASGTAPLTTKGDLLTFDTAAARLPVGNNGDTIVADSSTSTGLRYQGSQAAGKNLLINGAFDIWQRGTSFTADAVYTADRWIASMQTSNATISQVTSSLPTGFRNAIKVQRNSGSTSTTLTSLAQAIETINSIPLQGQTVTLSFWAKKGANFSDAAGQIFVRMYSGTGTDQNAASYGGWTGYSEWHNTSSVTPTTSWARYSITGTVPSTATEIGIRIGFGPVGTAGADDSFFITGVQLELGSVATSFARAGGTIQGELAACQRYYSRVNGTTVGGATWINGHISGSSPAYAIACYQYPVEMRVAPTITQSGSVRVSSASTLNDFSTFAGGAATKSLRTLYTPTSVTNGYACHIDFLSTAYIEMSAEL